MDFDLSGEQLAIRDTVRSFVHNECTPEVIRQLDESAIFPHELWKRLGEIGLLSGPIPTDHGGAGLGVLEECIVIEELSAGMFALGLTYQLAAFAGARAIATYGSDGQKAEYLPKIAAGEVYFAFGMTEPGGGTDILSALRTRAVEDGDNYRITGQKVYITNADVSDYVLTIARTSPPDGRKSFGLTMFVVPTSAPGLEIRRMPKLGGKCASTCEVFLDDVVVPASSIVGGRDHLWDQLVGTLNHERVTCAALSIGNARAALEDARAYALERVAFKKPIGAFQAIQHKLVDSMVEIEMARLLMYKAAAAIEAGQSGFRDATAAKMVASEVAFRAASRGMDILAGAGFLQESTMQRHFRDSRQLILGPITNEMARNALAVQMGLPRSY
jgi:acyl-CoA dehydrogenase